MIGDCCLKKIIDALDACMKCNKATRGAEKRFFTDYGKQVQFSCSGLQVSCNSQEVCVYAPFMEHLPNNHWKSLAWIMRCAEQCFKIFADHQVISHLHHAKKIVPFKTMSTPSSVGGSSFRYYGSIAIGCNIFLPCHTDQDFTMSIVQAFLRGVEKYNVKESIIVHFCFPTLGVAIPLQPGDYLMFNPLIPHCVSSRCNLSDEVVLVTIYLKTSVVGLNNNDMEITPAQASLARKFKCK